jgi:hypothetical protein
MCALAWHLSGAGHPASCFVSAICSGCGPNNELAGACTNTCQEPTECRNPARDIAAGGPDSHACEQFEGDRESCERAWHVGGSGTAASCFVAESECRGCDPSNESDGRCTNTCTTSEPQTCDDPARIEFVGGPGSAACRVFDGDQPVCERAWHIGGFGGAATCFYDAASQTCQGCGPLNEIEGRCDNTCLPPVACDDEGRELLGGLRSCHSLLSTAACNGAFVLTFNRRPASCYVEQGSCRECDLLAESEGRCVNACSSPPACADPLRTVDAGGPGGPACGQFDGDTASCMQAWQITGSGQTASCFVIEHPCKGCGPSNEEDGACTNDCNPPERRDTCELDPTRVIDAGGPDTEACRQFANDRQSCEQAWHTSRSGAASCFAETLCLGCGPGNQAAGECENTCTVGPVCGDGRLDEGEECEAEIFPGPCVFDEFCNPETCRCGPVPVCGDGLITSIERCDQTASPNGCPMGDNCLSCAFCVTPPYCGDGVITDDETCDSAIPFPSGCAEGEFCPFGTCRCEVVPVCGDEQITGFEACDHSADPTGCPPGKSCGHCSFCATPPVCGDGLITDDETCDVTIPFPSGCAEGEFCPFETCQCEVPPVCGDGQVTGFETCDQSADPSGCPAGEHCGHCSFCAVPPVCGDGLITDDETCDVGIPFPSGCAQDESCRFDICQCEAFPVCGDGQVTGFETCDQSADPNGCPAGEHCGYCFFCASPPVCGDGLITDDETCDVAIPFPSGCAEEEFCPFDTCQCDVFVGSPSGALLDATSEVLD